MEVRSQIPLSSHTTFGVGGPAEYFVEVSSIEELKEALSFALSQSLPVFLLGGGSNILVSDEGVRGLVIKIKIAGIEFTEVGKGEVEVKAGAGETWDKLVALCVEKGWRGLENLSAIPGTVGATPIQNVGAYGAEAGEVIARVEALDMRSCEEVSFSNNACRFGYRDSFFKSDEGKHFAVTRVIFRLSKTRPLSISYKDLTDYFGKRGIAEPSLQQVRDAVIEVRRGKFPTLEGTGTAGSFFKNPVVTESEFEKLSVLFPNIPAHRTPLGEVKLPLAWILDRLGWKGVSENHVKASEKQPLVLVRMEHASAENVRAFSLRIMRDVEAHTGIKIFPEVSFVGEWKN